MLSTFSVYDKIPQYRGVFRVTRSFNILANKCKYLRSVIKIQLHHKTYKKSHAA